MKFINLIRLVASHGFMVGPMNCETNEILGYTRNYKATSINIDKLRNPNIWGNCRSEPKEADVQIEQGVCIGLAISKNAEHKGPCKVYIDETEIQHYDNCIDAIEKISCENIPNLITNDMCFYKMTIPNIYSGLLKWTWEAQHNNPSEYYENCIDVIVAQNQTPTTTTTNDQTPNKPQNKTHKTHKTQPINNDQTANKTHKTPNNNNQTPTIEENDTCKHGQMKCNGNVFGTCVWGEWIWRSCAPNTKCKENNNFILCI
jgi:hypothetical protein